MNGLRRIAVLLLSVCFSINALSQEVVYSPYEKFDLRGGDFSVIGKVGGKIYTYVSSSDGFFLHAYNDSMEKMATVVLDFFPSKIYETKFVSYSDKIIALFQSVEGGKVVQYAALLDQNGRLLKGPIHLTSARTGFLGATRDYFSSAVSDDKTQILIYSIEEDGREIHLSGIWIDDQLNVGPRSTATFKAENDLACREGILGNDGSFYLPAHTPAGSKNFSDQLWVLSLPKGARRFHARELPLNDLFIASPFLKLDPFNSRIYTSGFYSDRKNGNYEGVLFSYYDLADSSFKNRRVLAFDERLRNATGERNLKRAFNNYMVKHMIIKKDGGFVLVSEDFFISMRSNMPGWSGYYSFYYGPFMSQTVREYNYDDIFALSYDGSGNLEWHSFVRKSQYSQEDGGIFSSFALINTGGALGFLFNDFNTRSSRIQLATLDAEGKTEMHSLAAGTSNDPDWLPRSGKQTGLKEMVIPCLRKRQISFAKIVF
jgi:hypothetical protein